MSTTFADYEVIGPIGSGSYGTCKKIRRKKDNKILVWKELNYGMMAEAEKQMLVSEVNLLRELKHQYIVHYYDRVIDRAHTTLYIIMEYCEGGDLASFILDAKKNRRVVEESVVWRWCEQVLLALRECHCRQRTGHAVLHRDLKPANVFLDSAGNVKLGDFGLARVLNHETSFARTFVGTPYYMSPEQMNYMSYNEKSDVWSVGCLLYELCALRPPFTAANRQELAKVICAGRFQRISARYSNDLNDLITYLLNVNEHTRPNIEQVLKHPLIVKYAASKSSDGASNQGRTSTEEAAGGGNSEGDEGYASKMDSLRRREEMVKQQLQQINEKERKVEIREKAVALREKLAEEKMARSEKMILDQNKVVTASSKLLSVGRPSPGCCSFCFCELGPGDIATHSCPAMYGRRITTDEKKRVSFQLDTADVKPTYSADFTLKGYLDSKRGNSWRQLQSMLDLDRQLLQARQKSSQYHYKTRCQLLGIQ